MRQELIEFVEKSSAISKSNAKYLKSRWGGRPDLESVSSLIPAEELIILIWPTGVGGEFGKRTFSQGYLVLTPRRLLFYSDDKIINLPILGISECAASERDRSSSEIRLQARGVNYQFGFFGIFDGGHMKAKEFTEAIMRVQILGS